MLQFCEGILNNTFFLKNLIKTEKNKFSVDLKMIINDN